MPYMIKCSGGRYAGYTSLAGEIFVLFASDRRKPKTWTVYESAKRNLETIKRVAGNKYNFEIVEFVENDIDDHNEN